MTRHRITPWLISAALLGLFACDDPGTASQPSMNATSKGAAAGSGAPASKTANAGAAKAAKTAAAEGEGPLAATEPKPYGAPEAAKLGTLPKGVGVPVGQQAPDFEVNDIDGKPTRLAKITADGTVLLFFYRGGW